MSAAIHEVPATAPSHGGAGSRELIHYPCCTSNDVALCATDLTGHETTNRRDVTCMVCDVLRKQPCARVCPLDARKES